MRIEKILVGFLALSAAGSLAAEIKQPVRVTGGLVSGFPGKDTSITVFRAIPFAAPPVGELRWRPTTPAAALEGVKSSKEFSNSCMQTIQTEERQPWTREFMTHNQVSEDCLYLNVFTPAKSASEKRAVLVYIYGGGFNDGSAAVPIYDGEGLAKKGVVMVTFNYRLNIMGFFVHPELSKESPNKVSGNYGLLDQIAALKWVQVNIAKFGGDPGRVTIAGQSAGGVAIHQLIASPLARGLFHRAIVQSGGSTLGGLIPVSALATSEAAGQRFAESKGAKSIAELRAMSWQKLTEPIPAATGVQTAASGRGGRGGPTYTSAPIVDGYVLPASPNEAIAQGKHADVPVLTGMDRDELGGIFPGRGAITLDSYRSRARERYGADADKFLALYPASGDQEAAAAQKEGRPRPVTGLHVSLGENAVSDLQDQGLPISLRPPDAGSRVRPPGRLPLGRGDLRPEHAVLGAEPSLCRGGSEDRRRAVVLLGQLRGEWRSERKRTARLARLGRQVRDHGDRRQVRASASSGQRREVCVLRGLADPALKAR